MSNVKPMWPLYTSQTNFGGQCAGQKAQMLRVTYENTYIIELKCHI